MFKDFKMIYFVCACEYTGATECVYPCSSEDNSPVPVLLFYQAGSRNGTQDLGLAGKGLCQLIHTLISWHIQLGFPLRQ